MILTVTLNAALDVTYRVGALVPHSTHRVTEVSERAGGKGLNVARVLHGLGEPVRATGLLGGDTGGRVQRLLDADGIQAAFERIGGETRRTIAVVDTDATGLWEPGPVVTPAEWAAFQVRFAELVRSATVVVFSGSLPRGVPVDAYATLITVARGAGARTILDTSGEPLRAALPARPDVIKPNLDELTALLTDATDALAPAGPGPTVSTADAPSAGDTVTAGDTADAELPRLAVRARGLGAGVVVASAGAAGMVAVTGEGAWRARPPERVAGNPTGAGDASVAALARGLRDDSPWPATLADAVALSAAAVAAPVAGTVDPETAARFRAAVIVTPITPGAHAQPSNPAPGDGHGDSDGHGHGHGEGDARPAAPSSPATTETSAHPVTATANRRARPTAPSNPAAADAARAAGPAATDAARANSADSADTPTSRSTPHADPHR